MRWWLLLLAGCREFYKLDDTRVLDAYAPVQCATVRFGAPQRLAQFDPPPHDGDEFDPQLSEDGNELWFVPNVSPARIQYGVRGSADEAFTISMPDFGVSGTTADPSLTGDGRRLVMVAKGTQEFLLEAVRAEASGPFTSLRLVNGLGVAPDSIDISWDGLRLYYTRNQELYVAQRPSLDEPFVPQAGPLFGTIEYPTVSPDELEIYYNHRGSFVLYRRVRASIDEPFGIEEFVLDDGVDADIAPHSTRMIIARDGGLAVLDRVCP